MDVQDYFSHLMHPPSGDERPERSCLEPQRIVLLLLCSWLLGLGRHRLHARSEKFEESYPARPYYVDVDTYYRLNDNINEAKETWLKLASKPADITTWHDFNIAFPQCKSVLAYGRSKFWRMCVHKYHGHGANNRTFCIRMNLADGIGSGIPPWIQELIAALVAEGATDYTIVF